MEPQVDVKISPCTLQFLDPNKGERLESSTGRVASRDMIQFAPMKDAHGMHFLLHVMILGILRYMEN